MSLSNIDCIWPLDKFEKDFQIIQCIGEGQYGQVFSAKSTKSNDLVAAKFLKCSRATEKLRIRDEIDILKHMNHDNVIQFIGAYESEDQFVQVLELLRY